MAPSVELRHLRTFRAAVDRNGFARAAEELAYAQSTVTLHIQQLEATLGVQLFDRGGKRFKLTDAGTRVYRECVAVLEGVTTLTDAARPFASGAAGSIHLGAIEPAASRRLPQILRTFGDAHPAVKVSVQVGGSEDLARAVSTRTLDVAIASAPDPGMDLRFTPLFDEELRVLLPQGHALTRMSSVRLADLNTERVLLTEATCAYRRLTEKEVLPNMRARPAVMEISSLETVGAAVAAGLGVAFVPAMAGTPAPPGTQLRAIRGGGPQLRVGLIRRADDQRASSALALFVSMLETTLGTTSPSARPRARDR